MAESYIGMQDPIINEGELEFDSPDIPNNFIDDPLFSDIVNDGELAIEAGLNPELIPRGSSGSYFVRGIKYGDKIAVFKPKDEEPYGKRNPKSLKLLQRLCSPCCFGRSCLVRNQGYLSEAGAYVIDYFLNLNIVPKTRVVLLASEVFNYSPIDIAKHRAKKNVVRKFPSALTKFNRIGLPPKIGSFQLFVQNYVESSTWICRHPYASLPYDLRAKFQFEFEKLVVLDYIIRNTDRTSDNWLIEEISISQRGDPAGTSEIKIAAIDNGLAFPYKHPDSWRTYPFSWFWSPNARIPFSNDIKDLILPIISEERIIAQMCDTLLHLFQNDADYNPRTFENQMAVMRGQITNLAKALNDGMTPETLVQMVPITIEPVIDSSTESNSSTAKFMQRIINSRPYFQWF